MFVRSTCYGCWVLWAAKRPAKRAAASRSLDRLAARIDQAQPCRVDINLHPDRDQAGFAKAGAEPDRLDVVRLASTVRAVCAAWAEPDRLGCVLLVSTVRPFQRSAGRSPGWVAVCFFMIWGWALVRRFGWYSLGPSRCRSDAAQDGSSARGYDPSCTLAALSAAARGTPCPSVVRCILEPGFPGLRERA